MPRDMVGDYYPNFMMGLGPLGTATLAEPDSGLFDTVALAESGPTTHSTKQTAQPAHEFLTRARDHMLERAATYDSPGGERSMGRTVTAFNAITGHTLTESEGWLLLQLLKDVRLFMHPAFHRDSAEDCVAYAALKAEARCEEGLRGEET